MKDGSRPLVVITTNEERSLPDAFLRRCFVLHLGLPDEGAGGDQQALCEALLVRGRAHFPKAGAEVLERAATLIAGRRAEMRKDRMPAPGIAEYIDLVDSVLQQHGDTPAAVALLDELKAYVLHKHAPPPAR